MELGAYRGKRRFDRTPEPAGVPPPDRPLVQPGSPLRFVVQRHRARRLHYDLRFEIDGVLVSWAVPKGPTLDPSVKRAAIHVEDHPIEYLDFEGVIPKGEYGGGDVIVWDQGTWRPHGTDEPAQAVASGELHADLAGEKLRGRFVLLRRTEPTPSKQQPTPSPQQPTPSKQQPTPSPQQPTHSPQQEQWLLLHKHDEFAVNGWDPEEHPRSVLSGRTNEEVQANPRRLWRSDLPAAQASIQLRPTAPSETEMRALADLGSSGTWSVFGRELRLTNLDKVLFPGRPGQRPVTKREFIGYAARIAPVILPYLAGRALNLHRFPNGAGAPGFWHKQLPSHAPDWVDRWDNPDAGPGETSTYLVVNEAAALVWAANFGALEWHAWTSRIEAPRLPTYALIDLDPGTATSWEDLLVLARLHRSALEHLGVLGVPKLTGRRGIQIWIPIATGASFEQTRAWVEQLSRAVAATTPELVSWKWEVAERGGQARLDYTQNAINKTLVAPYSPRAAAGAPVSAPISWPEFDDPQLRPDAFTVRNIFDRLSERGDPFRAVLDNPQRLPQLH
ncbi:MAG: DNA polymerase domain-containing protein [Mycobacteriales bacterium]